MPSIVAISSMGSTDVIVAVIPFVVSNTVTAVTSTTAGLTVTVTSYAVCCKLRRRDDVAASHMPLAASMLIFVNAVSQASAGEAALSAIAILLTLTPAIAALARSVAFFSVSPDKLDRS